MSDISIQGKTCAQFIDEISSTWQKSIIAVLDTGKLISEAKEKLDHGEFLAMIKNKLPFGSSTAQRLMKIAADTRLTNTAHVQHLPPSWGTLYEISKLEDDEFEANIANGTINPNMERRDIAQKIKAVKRENREIFLSEKITALPNKKYGAILADPEWKFKVYSEETGMDRSADNHYPTSDLETIKGRNVASIAAEDCALFLWATAPMLPQALEVMKAWGFEYKTHAIWSKLRSGNSRGTGYWFTGEHELLLLGTKGKIPAPIPGTQFRSLHTDLAGEHSRKPDWQYEIIERYFPNIPKIELNARVRRKGWDSWGNECPEDIEIISNNEIHSQEINESFPNLPEFLDRRKISGLLP